MGFSTGRICWVSKSGALLSVEGLELLVGEGVEPAERQVEALRASMEPSERARFDAAVERAAEEPSQFELRPAEERPGLDVVVHGIPYGDDGITCALLFSRQSGTRAGSPTGKGDLIADLAHKLRNATGTSTTAVQLMEGAARQAPLPRAVDQALSALGRQIYQMPAIIDDIVLAWRLVKRELALQPAPVKLIPVLRRAAGNLPRGSADDLDLDVADEGGADPRVLADARALEHMLTRILRSRRSAAVNVAVSAGDTTARIRFSSDAGWDAEPGEIPPAQRYGATTSDSSMLLSIASGIASAHGGGLSIDPDGQLVAELPMASSDPA